MLSRVDPMIGRPQALCVCPTRELVVQNVDVLRRMSKHTAITALSTAVSDIEMPYTRRASSQTTFLPPPIFPWWQTPREEEVFLLGAWREHEAQS